MQWNASRVCVAQHYCYRITHASGALQYLNNECKVTKPIWYFYTKNNSLWFFYLKLVLHSFDAHKNTQTTSLILSAIYQICILYHSRILDCMLALLCLSKYAIPQNILPLQNTIICKLNIGSNIKTFFVFPVHDTIAPKFTYYCS